MTTLTPNPRFCEYAYCRPPKPVAPRRRRYCSDEHEKEARKLTADSRMFLSRQGEYARQESVPFVRFLERLGFYLNERPSGDRGTYYRDQLVTLKKGVGLERDEIRARARALRRLVQRELVINPKTSREGFSLWAGIEEVILGTGEEGEPSVALPKLRRRLHRILLLDRECGDQVGAVKTFLSIGSWHRFSSYALGDFKNHQQKAIDLASSTEGCLDLPKIRRAGNVKDALLHQIVRFRVERLAFDGSHPDQALRSVEELSKRASNGFQTLEAKRTAAGVHFAAAAGRRRATGSTKLIDLGERALEEAKNLALQTDLFDIALPVAEFTKLYRTELVFAGLSEDRSRYAAVAHEMANLSSRSRDAYYEQILRDSGKPLAKFVPVTRVMFDGFHTDPVLVAA